MDPTLQTIYAAILDGNQAAAQAGVQTALESALALLKPLLQWEFLGIHHRNP
jgi:hypothetical protein